MNAYLRARVEKFEEKHLQQEWPPARFPDAALEDASCHTFPLYVRGNYWTPMVLQKADDGQWARRCHSSLAGYDMDFAEPWQVISSWLLFTSKGVFHATSPQRLMPSPQPSQDSDRDCGVFVPLG